MLFRSHTSRMWSRIDGTSSGAGGSSPADSPDSHPVASRAARARATVGEISEAIGVEGPTVVRALQRMASAGIVVRRKHPSDGRQIAIHLTPKGARLRRHVPRALGQVEERAFSGFSRAERAQLLSMLARVEANLRD